MPDETRSAPTPVPDPTSAGSAVPLLNSGVLPATQAIDGPLSASLLQQLPAGDGFTLLAEIARGGMGVVYKARDHTLGRVVAVKLLHERYPAASSVAGRFFDEARITGQLQHPGIPPVYQVGTLPDGRPFLAMKLIKGNTLEDHIRQRPASAPDRGRLVAAFEQVCQAVAYAHDRGVIHRDLKPANVMVGAFGEVQVMDWGLAKVIRNADFGMRNEDEQTQASMSSIPHSEIRIPNSEQTLPGAFLGTPAYMAPEQAIGATDQIDMRTDVFGLGGILAAILTGRPVFVGENAESTRQLAARGRVEECFARLDASGADPELVALCKRCMSVEPAERPAVARDVAEAVAGFRAAAEERARQAAMDRLATEVRVIEEKKRRRVLTWAAAAVVVVLAAGVAVSWWQTDVAQQARIDAEVEADNARTAEQNERTARQDADRQRDEAIKQEKAATTVKNFLSDVFQLSTAEWQLWAASEANPNITVREALVVASKLMEGRFRDQPEIEAYLRNAIGLSLGRLGAYREAAPFHVAALEIGERVFGPDDLRTLQYALNLGSVCHWLGQQERAADLFARAAKGRERLLGPEARLTLDAQSMLGLQWVVLRRHTEAEALLTRVHAAYEQILGPDHVRTLFTAYCLGMSYSTRGEHARAEPILKLALGGLEKAAGPDHPDTLEAVTRLGMCYWGRNQFGEAEPLLTRAFRTREKVLGPHHPRTLASGMDLGFFIDTLQRHKEVDDVWRRVYAGRATLPFWVLAWQRHWSASRWGSVLVAGGKYAEAEPLLLEGYRGLVDTGGPQVCKRWAAEWLVWLYSAWGRPDEAMRWQEEREKYVGTAPPPREVKRP